MKVDNLLFLIALIFYLSALAFYGRYLFRKQEEEVPARRWGIPILLGFALHTLVLIRQASSLIRLDSMHISGVLILLSWSLVGLILLLQRRIRLRILFGITLGIALAMGGIALALSKYFSKDVPSLNAFWFGTHIFLSLLGYAAFALALVSGILYLILDRQLKLKVSRSFFSRLPPLESLESINFKSLWVGAVLLGMGLVSGLLWAKWANLPLSLRDPKVLAAWATWVIYGLIIYIRTTTRWRGRKVAYLTVLGFSSVLVTFFVMNYFSKGHGFF